MLRFQQKQCFQMTFKLDAQIISTLVISDPETGEVWEWILPETDVNTTISIPINSGALGFGTLSADFEEITCTITTNIDISDYLNETLASTAISTTLYDDINITTGLTYSANYSTNTVSIYSVFGSTPPQGYYYASNRRVVWCPGCRSCWRVLSIFRMHGPILQIQRQGPIILNYPRIRF